LDSSTATQVAPIGRDSAPLPQAASSGKQVEPQPAVDAGGGLPGITLDESRWKTYSNQKYHFEIKYPPELTPTIPFQVREPLTGSWRVMADATDPGEQIISFPVFRLTNRTAYPRFYQVELRIGASKADETSKGSRCAATNGERSLGPVTINGTALNQFEFSDAAMMKYVSGISYRLARDGICLAVEQVRAGSNYRDTASTRDIPQKTLDQYYYVAGKMVKTLRFTR
jgi:hypothetical protein